MPVPAAQVYSTGATDRESDGGSDHERGKGSLLQESVQSVRPGIWQPESLRSPESSVSFHTPYKREGVASPVNGTSTNYHYSSNNGASSPANFKGPLESNDGLRSSHESDGESRDREDGQAIVQRIEMLLDAAEDDVRSPSADAAQAAVIMRDAVRRLREDASAIAFKIGELHACDAAALRRAAGEMKEHVNSLQQEIEELERDVQGLQIQVWPTSGILKEAAIAGGILAAVFGVQHVWDRVSSWFRGPNPGRTTWAHGRQRRIGSAVPAAESSSRPHFLVPLLLALGFISSRLTIETYKRVHELVEENRTRKYRLLGLWRTIAERVTVMATLAESGNSPGGPSQAGPH